MFYGGVAFSQDSYASFGVVAEAPTVVNLAVVSATAGLGTVSVSIAGAGSVSFTVTGLAGTTSLGSAESVVITPVNLTGVSATGVIGTATVEFNAFASATGVLGTSQVGKPVVYGIIEDVSSTWTDVPN